MTEVAASHASSYALNKGVGKGHRMLALTFSTITDGLTFDTGLDHVDGVAYTMIAAAAAANVLSVTAAATKGVLTFGVAGTAAGAYVTVVGSVKGYAE